MNKHTIHKIVSNLLTTRIYSVVFVFSRKTKERSRQMKKLLTLTAVGAILAAPAMAVQKCVALDAETTTCTSTATYGKADWSATCTTNDKSVSILGIATCAIDAASLIIGSHNISTMVTTAGSDGDTTKKSCWCKMVSPAISSWVSVTHTGDCSYQCSYQCASFIRNNLAASTFRSKMLSSISN